MKKRGYVNQKKMENKIKFELVFINSNIEFGELDGLNDASLYN